MGLPRRRGSVDSCGLGCGLGGVRSIVRRTSSSWGSESGMGDLPDGVELLTTISLALANWSSVELELTVLFKAISELHNHKKANALFDGIISFEIRVGICDRLMAFEKIDPIEGEMWARMSAKLTKYYKKRHELAHFSIIEQNGVHKLTPFVTVEKLIDGFQTTLDTQQVIDRADKFKDLQKAVAWFSNRALVRHGFRESPQQEEPERPLVAQLRELAVLNLARR